MKRFFSFIAAGMILLVVCLVQAAANTDMKAVVASLQGKVEVRPAGSFDWKFAKRNQELGHNDMLRTYEASKAVLQYKDGSQIVVHENSQILLNAASAKNKMAVSKYVTAFFGAAFFLIQEAMPKAYLHNVYTPTAVISIRGTSFGVTVDPKTGMTNLAVIDGCVLARNILMNQEYFVKGGAKSQIALNAAPTPPRALVAEDLSALKKWVGEEMLSAEQAKQEKRGRRNALVINNKAEDKIVVARFTDNSGYSGSWNLAQGLTAMIAGELKPLTGAQVSVANDAALDADELGKRENARLVICGEIESFELTKIAQISAEADSYSEFYKATVGMNLHIVDPASGTQVKTIQVVEEVKAPDSPENDWKVLGAQTFDLKNEKFRKGLFGQVIEKALKKFSLEASAYL